MGKGMTSAQGKGMGTAQPLESKKQTKMFLMSLLRFEAQNHEVGQYPPKMPTVVEPLLIIARFG